MYESLNSQKTCIVTGASGQDGYFLTENLISEGCIVHAVVRNEDNICKSLLDLEKSKELYIHVIDLVKPDELIKLISQIKPDEVYNLAGESSVSQSFINPSLTWETNFNLVFKLLECIRIFSPETHFFQSCSTEMFGDGADECIFNEKSCLNPLSPYASAKAASFILCQSYRKIYNLRIACGILSNHESYRRGHNFLSSKIVRFVKSLRKSSLIDLKKIGPLRIGNLKIKRDWGYAPEYIMGIKLIARQIEVRAERANKTKEKDEGVNYKDYLLSTGRSYAVWQLVDCAFNLEGYNLEWNLEGDEPEKWFAKFKSTGLPAVIVDQSYIRTSDPYAIYADSSLAKEELGWIVNKDLNLFLKDMLEK